MLETYLKPVLSKHRGVALGVWGEAGIGKSHAVASVLKKLPCHSLSLHASTPLQSFVSQLTKPKKLAIWAGKTLERVQKGEGVETSNLVSAMAASLAGLAPFVLHVEDMHEANPERLAFLRDLAQTVRKLKGVALLVTSRHMPSEPFMAVKLEPLSHEDSDKLLESELKALLPKEGLEFIYSKAAGNPLFTLEYVRFLARAGHLWNDGKSWYWRKPEKDTLPAVVEVLLEQMIMQAKTVPMHRYVLESKALLPLDASDELWEKVARVTAQELHSALGELSTRGVFKGNGFAHPLVREVALKTLSSDRRQHLARRAINVLRDAPEQAALFIDDAKLENEEALELLRGAAFYLETTNKKIEAARYLEKALPYLEGEDKGQLALKVAQLFSKAGDDRAFALAELATAHLKDKVDAQKIIALSYALRGERDEMMVVFGQLSHHIDDNFLLQCLFTTSAFDEIVKRLDSFVLKDLTSSSVYFIAYSLMEKGDLITALNIAEEQLNREGLTPSAKAELLDVCASVFHYQGKYQKADPIFSEIIELYKEESIAWDGFANALRNRAINRLLMGQYREVLPDFLESLGLYAERGARIQYAQTLVMMSDVYFELAEYGKMETILTESLAIFERVKPQPFYAHALTNLTYLYSKQEHNVMLALKYAQKALDISGQLESNLYESMVLIAASSADTLAGHLPCALERADKALVLACDAGLKELSLKAQFNKAQVLVALHQESEARKLFQTAMQEAAEAGTPFAVHRIGIELDRLNNDLESARTHMQWFEERGLMNGVNIAKRYFPELATEDAPPIILTSEDMPRLEVLGLMQISQHKKIEAVKGRKRQELVALLLDARLSGRTEVGRLELFDKLYSSEDELKATNNLKDLVYALRENLGANAIVTTANGYALGTLDSDAEQFLKTGDTNLWRSVYLEGLTVEGQETVSESLYLLLFEKARELLQTDPKETARLGRVLLEYDPYNRDYLTLCLQALRASNNHKSLTRSYTEARKRFVEVGETLPVSWRAFLG
jgi:tetratricopeptide (TPR) repeat protein